MSESAPSVLWLDTVANNGNFGNDTQRPPQPFTIPIPNAALREASSVAALDVFFAIGEAWASVVMHFLPPHPTVLDMGCSCGKLARFLAFHPELHYIGIDLFLPAIEWCQTAFAPVTGPRFRFVHFDGYSKLYNPQGKVQSKDYRFPLPSHSIDCVVGASLCTHLLLDDCRHYLREIARVLTGRGCAVLSIHTEPKPGELFSGDEARIDIDPVYFQQLAAEAGLSLRSNVGKVYGQDLFVFGLAE